MAIPDRVPIARIRFYRTRHIGHYAGGQFLGSVAATLDPAGDAEPDLGARKRWYSVLHRFDPTGAHTGSDIWFAGTSEEERAAIRRAKAHLTGQLKALPGRAFGDIAIGLFHVEVDGHVFGLVDGSDLDAGHDHAELLPNALGFDPPWDGRYDT
jgi:hypothetical protein